VIFGGIFDFDAKVGRLEEVVKLAEDPALWQDNKRAQEIGKERKALEATVGTIQRVAQGIADSRELLELVREEDDEAGLESI
jgi:peptide chain release factor 2